LKQSIALTTLLLLPAALSGAESIDSGQFETCAQAREIVARAGEEGIRIDRRPDRIFSDAQCFQPYLLEQIHVFEEKVQLKGQWCTVGYSCIEVPMRG
jgi:hypothetical protein